MYNLKHICFLLYYYHVGLIVFIVFHLFLFISYYQVLMSCFYILFSVTCLFLFNEAVKN